MRNIICILWWHLRVVDLILRLLMRYVHTSQESIFWLRKRLTVMRPMLSQFKWEFSIHMTLFSTSETQSPHHNEIERLDLVRANYALSPAGLWSSQLRVHEIWVHLTALDRHLLPIWTQKSGFSRIHEALTSKTTSRCYHCGNAGHSLTRKICLGLTDQRSEGLIRADVVLPAWLWGTRWDHQSIGMHLMLLWFVHTSLRTFINKFGTHRLGFDSRKIFELKLLVNNNGQTTHPPSTRRGVSWSLRLQIWWRSSSYCQWHPFVWTWLQINLTQRHRIVAWDRTTSTPRNVSQKWEAWSRLQLSQDCPLLASRVLKSWLLGKVSTVQSYWAT